METRIELTDSPMTSMLKMAEGNPGATTIMLQIFQHADKIDPQAFMGGLGVILSLDTHNIYGPRIWMLYKDVCKENIVLLIATLRSVQLGMVPVDKLNHAIDNYGEGLDVEELHNKVCDRLDDFQKTLEIK